MASAGVLTPFHHQALEAEGKGGNLSASRLSEVTGSSAAVPGSRWEPEIQAGWAQQLQAQQPQLDVAVCPSCLALMCAFCYQICLAAPFLQMRRLGSPDPYD